MTASAPLAAAPAATGPAVRRARIAVVAVFVVHGLLFASWTPHIPQVKAALSLSDASLGVALLGAPVGSLAAMAITAWLMPRLGSRWLVRGSLCGYCLAGLLVTVTGSLPALFAALAAWGFFQGMLDISMNTQAVHIEGAHGRPIMNGTHAFWSLGAFAGAGLGTVAVAAHISLRPQLAVLGVTALVITGWLTLRMLADAPVEHTPVPRRRRDAWRRVPAIVLLLGAIAFAAMLCEGAAQDWSSVYLRDSLGTSATVGGLGYTAFAMATVAVRALGDRLLLRFGPGRLLPVLAAVATVAMTVALAVGRPAAAVTGLFLLGAGVGAIVPTAFSAAGRQPGLHPGVSVALVSGLGWAGFVCGPPLIGQLAGLASLPVALAVVPLLTAFLAVSTGRLQAHRDRNVTSAAV